MATVIRPISNEIAAPTTLVTGSNVSRAKVVRAVNSTGTIATITTGYTLVVTTSAANPGDGATTFDIILDSVAGLEVGDAVVGTGIQAGSVIASIDSGTNTITLDLALTAPIDGTSTPVDISTFRDGVSTSILGNTELLLNKATEDLVYASAGTVLLTNINYPKG